MSANDRRHSNHPEAVLACALLASATPANPMGAAPDVATAMNGGGGALGGEVLSGTGGEFALFNSTATKAVFGTFWASGTGAAQKAFINNDLSCDIDAVTGANGGACVGPDGGANNTVDYAAAEVPLSATQISTWATSSFGQADAGNLIQIPAFGIAPAIVVNDTNITQNGELELSDNDLCGIYSGLITDFSQITDSKPSPAAGQFRLVYRADGSLLSFLLTNHLNAVCTSANTLPGITFTATTNFASLFPGGIDSWIPNAVGEVGDAGVANYLSGLSGGAVPQALGYASTGWTSLYPDSQTALSNGTHSALLVAALKNGGMKYQPTNANVAKGLLNPEPGTGQNLTPPTNAAEGANPALWVPIMPVIAAKAGYPIVGYTEFVVAQCYKSAAVGKGVVSFLKDHYGKANYQAIQNANGFVTLKEVTANGFLAAIEDNILADDHAWIADIQDPTACAELIGR
jgi:ABC-type phosphate transport system substrate-binding protein